MGGTAGQPVWIPTSEWTAFHVRASSCERIVPRALGRAALAHTARCVNAYCNVFGLVTPPTANRLELKNSAIAPRRDAPGRVLSNSSALKRSRRLGNATWAALSVRSQQV